MDDFRLKVFITAARTLSFTRAAEQLCISQPAVSKHVAELEARYGLQLFTRRGSRLELTDAGRTLLDAAERLADDYRRLEYEMSLCTGQTEGELRLGASTTIAQYLLPPLLARFAARFPQVRVSLLSGNSGQVEQGWAIMRSTWVWSRASAAGRGCTIRCSGPMNWCWWRVRAGSTPVRSPLRPKRCAGSRSCCAKTVRERSK